MSPSHLLQVILVFSHLLCPFCGSSHLSLPTWIITSPSPSLVPVEAVWPNVKLFLVLTHYENLPDWGFLSELPLLKFALRQTLCHFILIFFQNRENSKSLILILKWVLVSSKSLLRIYWKLRPPTRAFFSTVPSYEGAVEKSTLLEHHSNSDQKLLPEIENRDLHSVDWEPIIGKIFNACFSICLLHCLQYTDEAHIGRNRAGQVCLQMIAPTWLK